MIPWSCRCIPSSQRSDVPQTSNCTTSVAPFSSCGVPDTCFPAPAASPAVRFIIEPYSASVPAAATPSDAAAAPDTAPAPAPAPALAAGPTAGTDPRAELLQCQEKRVPGACCAADAKEAFSCIMVPQTAAQTPLVDYEWRCLPTATLPAAA